MLESVDEIDDEFLRAAAASVCDFLSLFLSLSQSQSLTLSLSESQSLPLPLSLSFSPSQSLSLSLSLLFLSLSLSSCLSVSVSLTLSVSLSLLHCYNPPSCLNPISIRSSHPPRMRLPWFLSGLDKYPDSLFCVKRLPGPHQEVDHYYTRTSPPVMH